MNNKIYFIGWPGFTLYSLGSNSSFLISEFDPSGEKIFSALGKIAAQCCGTFYTQFKGRFVFKSKLNNSVGANTPGIIYAAEHFEDGPQHRHVWGNNPKITSQGEIKNQIIGTFANDAATEIYPAPGAYNESAEKYGNHRLELDLSYLTSTQDTPIVRAILREYFNALSWPIVRMKFSHPLMDYLDVGDFVTQRFRTLGYAYNILGRVEGIDLNITGLEQTTEIAFQRAPALLTANQADSGGGGLTLITSAEVIGQSIQVTVTDSSGFAAGDFVKIYCRYWDFETSIVTVDSTTAITLTEIKHPIAVNDKAYMLKICGLPAWDIDFVWDFSGWDAQPGR